MKHNEGMKRDGLTDKQRKFVEEYLKTWNASQAALTAGYTGNNARWQASALLKKPHILQAIHAKQKADADANDVSRGRVVRELSSVGFAKVSKVTEKGKIAALKELARSLGYVVKEHKHTHDHGEASPIIFVLEEVMREAKRLEQRGLARNGSAGGTGVQGPEAGEGPNG